MTQVRRYPGVRSPAARAFARVALVLLLVAVAAALWLVFVSVWADAAGRAIPPVV